MTTKRKKLTVVTWDADYRENMKDGLECLKKQTIKDEIDFIHIEWGDKVNPILLEYDFIKKYNLNLPKRKIRPSFDTGVQLNFGLYASKTPWVSYFHFDIIPKDFYENVLFNINEIEKNNSPVIYMEGWYINQDQKRNRDVKIYNKWKNKLGNDLDLLPYVYTPASTPKQNSIGMTIKKQELLDICDGWYYNVPHRSEWHNGGGLGDKLFHPSGKISLLTFLLNKKMAKVIVKNMVGYALPHPPPTGKYGKFTNPIYSGGIKHYSNFIEEWVPMYEKNIIIT